MVRYVVASLLLILAFPLFIWALIYRHELNQMKVVPVPWRTKTVTNVVVQYKPAPPPQSYSTGVVKIKVAWFRALNDKHAGGEYQLETPGGIISVIVLCPPEPSFDRGDLVEIFYTNKRDAKADCFPFLNARRIK